MNAAALVAQARSLGITIGIDGDELVVRPASKLTPDLRNLLRGAKPELLELLRVEHEGGSCKKSNDAGFYQKLKPPAPSSSFSRQAQPSRASADSDILAGIAAGAADNFIDPTSFNDFNRQDLEARIAGLLDAQTTVNEARQKAARSIEAGGAGRLPSGCESLAPNFDALVQRLAAALMTPRPWMRITDPERARGYFEARARHVLATAARDPLAVVEREELCVKRLDHA
jgi:hypothetical protein